MILCFNLTCPPVPPPKHSHPFILYTPRNPSIHPVTVTSHPVHVHCLRHYTGSEYPHVHRKEKIKQILLFTCHCLSKRNLNLQEPPRWTINADFNIYAWFCIVLNLLTLKDSPQLTHVLFLSSNFSPSRWYHRIRCWKLAKVTASRWPLFCAVYYLAMDLKLTWSRDMLPGNWPGMINVE